MEYISKKENELNTLSNTLQTERPYILYTKKFSNLQKITK